MASKCWKGGHGCENTRADTLTGLSAIMASKCWKAKIKDVCFITLELAVMRTVFVPLAPPDLVSCVQCRM